MSDTMHPAAPHHLPGFITAPGETDVLLTGSAVFLVVLVFILGSTYFWLHSIPERIAHGTSKLQFQLVAVLSLLALFTHNNAFWIGALLLALAPIPDFWTPLATMAESLAKMARRGSGTASGEAVISLPDAPAATAATPHDPVIELSAPPREATGITHLTERPAPHTGDAAPPFQATEESKSGSQQRRATSTEGA